MNNTLKTFIFMAGLTALLVVIGNVFGGQTGMFIAFVFALAMNFASYWFSDKIVKNRDILIDTVAATIAGAISMLANIAQLSMLFGGGRGDDEEGGQNPLAMLAMIIIAPLAAMMIQMAISRSREYIADEDGARIAGSPHYLSGALRKLHNASQQIPLEASPATAHMFIVSPLSGGGIVSLFSTHPPMEKRIARLESLRLA
jgi:heat shock protein HtpX